MELNALRAALRGISAYRDVTNTTILSGIWMLLDALHQKNGEEALEYYVSRFHILRSDGYEGLGDWLWDFLRYTETPTPGSSTRGSLTPPWRTPPDGTSTPWSCWPRPTVTGLSTP